MVLNIFHFTSKQRHPIMQVFEAQMQQCVRKKLILRRNCLQIPNETPERLLRDLLPINPSLVYDVGANVGHFTVIAGELGHSVVSFEANPKTCSQLREKINSHRLKSVQVYCVAVGNNNSEVQVDTSSLDSASTSVIAGDSSSASAEVQMVKMKTLDSISINHTIFLLKSDTQGYELEVLKGALKTLQRSRPIILVELSYSLLNKIGNTRPSAVANFLYAHLDYLCTYLAVHTKISTAKYGIIEDFQFLSEECIIPTYMMDKLLLRPYNKANNTGWTDLLCFDPLKLIHLVEYESSRLLRDLRYRVRTLSHFCAN
uniref:Methyltransferase FkbM domain-containing protein n=1 Tax=Guillardia theta TaxID=55529 RepID=A0A7S4P828_GUITH